MAFYSSIIGLCIILLSMKLILINEETFILVSFSLFFYYIVTSLSPQVTESIDTQISKIETTIKSNFINIKNDYLILKKLGSSLVFKLQIENLQYVVVNNIKEIFKHKSYNFLSSTKNSQILSFQIIKNLENSIYKLIYLSMYIEVSKIIASKQYWLTNFKEPLLLSKSKIENQGLLNKI
uniref:Ymf39 n=1 Tax=Sahlingia subintegra TaxID=468936 RepID=UPI001FCD8338|nr:Ymf39 [Sahlingia subintegra]UNJ19063.1 Ymf39 [Sahlingia subintegra]